MYDPPSLQNWVYTNPFDEIYRRAYDEGYNAAQRKLLQESNPYKPSGHERDTTLDDELYYWWYSGYEDGINGNSS